MYAVLRPLMDHNSSPLDLLLENLEIMDENESIVLTVDANKLVGDFRINERIFRKGEEQSKDSKMSEVLKIHFERDKNLLELAKEGY